MKNKHDFDGGEPKKQSSLIDYWKIIAIIAIVVVIIVLLVKENAPAWAEVALPILYSIIAGLIVSATSDIPAIINTIIDRTSERTIEWLVSNGFLKSLSKDKLKTITDDSIRLRYSAVQKESTPAVLDLSDKVCNLLNHYYYRSYNEDITIKGGEKSSVITFEIINNTGKEGLVDVGIRKFFPNDIQAIASLFQVVRYDIQIDNSPKLDISRHITSKVTEAKDELDVNKKAYESVYRCYTSGVLSRNNLKEFSEKGTGLEAQSDDKIGIYARFNDRIWVSIFLKQPFDDSDLAYTKSLRYLAKSFSITSNCPDDYCVSGSLIGPFVRHNKQYSVLKDKNTGKLIIKCDDWQLPGNGAVLVYNKLKK